MISENQARKYCYLPYYVNKQDIVERLKSDLGRRFGIDFGFYSDSLWNESDIRPNSTPEEIGKFIDDTKERVIEVLYQLSEKSYNVTGLNWWGFINVEPSGDYQTNIDAELIDAVLEGLDKRETEIIRRETAIIKLY